MPIEKVKLINNSANQVYPEIDPADKGTEVVANPTLAGTEADLNGIQVGDTKYKVPNGTDVVANPTLAGTEADLTGLQVGTTKYKVPSGGGGGAVNSVNEKTGNVVLTQTDIKANHGAVPQYLEFASDSEYPRSSSIGVPGFITYGTFSVVNITRFKNLIQQFIPVRLTFSDKTVTGRIIGFDENSTDVFCFIYINKTNDPAISDIYTINRLYIRWRKTHSQTNDAVCYLDNYSIVGKSALKTINYQPIFGSGNIPFKTVNNESIFGTGDIITRNIENSFSFSDKVSNFDYFDFKGEIYSTPIPVFQLIYDSFGSSDLYNILTDDLLQQITLSNLPSEIPYYARIAFGIDFDFFSNPSNWANFEPDWDSSNDSRFVLYSDHDRVAYYTPNAAAYLWNTGSFNFPLEARQINGNDLFKTYYNYAAFYIYNGNDDTLVDVIIKKMPKNTYTIFTLPSSGSGSGSGSGSASGDDSNEEYNYEE